MFEEQAARQKYVSVRPVDHVAIRIVHLLGGLQAFDEGTSCVRIAPGEGVGGAQINRPPYAALYQVLKSINLTTVGVEFIRHPRQASGLMPTDWQTYGVAGGFKLRESGQEWTNVRHQAVHERNETVFDIASRCGTYLELINLRLLHLSSAYAATLRSHLVDTPEPSGDLFSTLFQRDIEASVHAFLADAAAFRDLLAEACWRLVLNRTDSSVTTWLHS